MSGFEDPAVIRVAAATLRALRDWSQADFAAAAGVAVSTVSRCESGDQVPTRSTFDRLAAAAGVPPRLLERLLSWIREALATPPGAGSLEEPRDVAAAELADSVARLTEAATSPGDLKSDVDQALALLEKERGRAKELWARLEPFPAEERFFLVEEAPEYHRWELSVLLCELSLEASVGAAESRELAALALHVAAQVLEAGKTGKDVPAEIREVALTNWDLYVARRREHNPLGWSSAKARALLFLDPKK
jgi:transcriptional regulator with XRE-family HTH domain